jgi:tRNA dimethylallyltransferase
LAISLAQQLGGTIINADSMQVYADLRVLSARPSPQEEQDAPHKLFGHVDGAVNYSLGHWLREAEEVLGQLRATESLPIITGGTGLYFKALLRGLSDIPPVSPDIREAIRAEAEGLPVAELHARLAACDPVMAERLRPTDPQRILRALEVFAATGQSLASFQSKRGPALLDPETCLCLFLNPERDWIYQRIDRRFEEMIEAGALGEVRKLAARHLDPALPVMRAVGVPGLMAYLDGKVSLEEAVQHSQADSRQYAKRQFTFIRNQLPEFVWVSPDEALQSAQAMLAQRRVP